MKVKLLTSLGTRDAIQLEMNVESSKVGAEVTVSEKQAEYLLSQGWCEVIDELKAVAPTPKISKAKEPDRDSLSK